jgi:hypothetical protein
MNLTEGVEGYLLSSANLFSWEMVLAGIVALAAALAAMLSPRSFWPILIVANIFGNHPRLKGYFFLDEIITGALVLGILLRLCLAERGTDNRDRFSVKPLPAEQLFSTLFLVWCVYLTAQAVIGTIVNDDLRIIRWVLYYGLVAVLAAVVRRFPTLLPFPDFRSTSILVMVTSLVTYLLYLGQGVLFEHILPDKDIFGHLGRFQSQHVIWAGSAYAVFPNLVAIPAAIFVMNDRSRSIRWMAWTLLTVIMVIGFYYDSRITWYSLGGFAIVSLHRMKFARLVMVVGVFCVVFATFVPQASTRFPEFVENLTESVHALWAPSKSDQPRSLQFKAGFEAIRRSPESFFFGDGIYSHRHTIIPYIKRLYRENLEMGEDVIQGSRNDPLTIEIFRTTAFTAILIDTGTVGMMLMAAVFGLACLRQIALGHSDRWIFFMGIAMTLLWLLVNNVNDILLMFLILMPHGLMEQWSRARMQDPTLLRRRWPLLQALAPSGRV